MENGLAENAGIKMGLCCSNFPSRAGVNKNRCRVSATRAKLLGLAESPDLLWAQDTFENVEFVHFSGEITVQRIVDVVHSWQGTPDHQRRGALISDSRIDLQRQLAVTRPVIHGFGPLAPAIHIEARIRYSVRPQATAIRRSNAMPLAIGDIRHAIP